MGLAVLVGYQGLLFVRYERLGWLHLRGLSVCFVFSRDALGNHSLLWTVDVFPTRIYAPRPYLESILPSRAILCAKPSAHLILFPSLRNKRLDHSYIVELDIFSMWESEGTETTVDKNLSVGRKPPVTSCSMVGKITKMVFFFSLSLSLKIVEIFCHFLKTCICSVCMFQIDYFEALPKYSRFSAMNSMMAEGGAVTEQHDQNWWGRGERHAGCPSPRTLGPLKTCYAEVNGDSQRPKSWTPCTVHTYV